MKPHHTTNFLALSVIFVILLGAEKAANADTFTFDFEGLATTSGGALTSLTQTQAGFSVTINRAAGFDVVVPGPFGTTGFGTRSLRPRRPSFPPTALPPFIANFSQAASSVSISIGDLFADPFEILSLEAFSGLNGQGTLLGSAVIFGPTAFGQTLTVTVPGINSISFIAVNDEPTVIGLYDNLVVTTGAIPEPTTLLLLGTGLAGIAAKVRKRRKVEKSEEA